VGQELRGDDGVGPAIARMLGRPRLPGEWLVLDGGPAPESCTGPVRRHRPNLVLFLDAAEMGAPVGTVRWLDWRDVDGCGGSTHSLPLATLAGFLAAELVCEVGVLGVQPGGNEISAPLSPAARRAAGRIAAAVRAGVSTFPDSSRSNAR
jgi:hydrogenase 3 maturation protease